MIRLLALLCALGGAAGAAVIVTGPVADLMPTCSASCGGAVARSMPADGAASMVVQYVISATATIKLENCIEQSPDLCTTNSTWTDVSGSSQAASTKFVIPSPVGFYRANVTYTSGSVRVLVRTARLQTGGQ